MSSWTPSTLEQSGIEAILTHLPDFQQGRGLANIVQGEGERRCHGIIKARAHAGMQFLGFDGTEDAKPHPCREKPPQGHVEIHLLGHLWREVLRASDSTECDRKMSVQFIFGDALAQSPKVSV